MEWFSEMSTLQFASPFMLLVAIPLVLMALLGMRGIKAKGRKNNTTQASATKNMPAAVFKKAAFAKRTKIILIFAIIFLLTITAAAPETRTSEEDNESLTEVNASHVSIVFDISGSMRSGIPWDDDSSRFDVGRDGVIYFLEQYAEAMPERAGTSITFYANDPILYRRPVYGKTEIDPLIDELQRLSLDRPGSDASPGAGQLSYMSRGTDTPPALYFAGRMLQEEEREHNTISSSVILVIDLHERRSTVFEAIEDLAAVGINVYVLSITPNERATNELIERYSASNDVHVFDVYRMHSRDDLTEVSSIISELEVEAVEIRANHIYREYSTNYAFAYALLAFLLLFLLLSELLWRKARTGKEAGK